MTVVGFLSAAGHGRLALLAVVTAAIATAVTPGAPAAATARAKGIDVSNWQGSINWSKVAGAGYTFAFGKATEGTTYTDPTYAQNRSGSEGQGLVFGAYHFARPGGTSRATVTQSATAQADYFVDVAAPQPGELPPVLDLEVTGKLGPVLLELWAQTWLDEVYARTGVRGLVYTSPNFWKDRVGDSTAVAAAGYRLWIAHWTSASAPTVPAQDWNGTGWTFWQWTNSASVPGIGGRTDGDRMLGTNPHTLAIGPYASGVPAVATQPTVVGIPEAGKILAARPGTWTGGKPVQFSYQWQRCDAAGANCVAIPAATGETYRAAAIDVGHSLSAAVTATSSAGSATAPSAPTVAVSPAGTPPSARPAAIVPPSISGTAQVGQVLSGSVGTWSGAPTTFAYGWRRCDATTGACVTIAHATGRAYTLTPDDIGSTIALVVTATGPGGVASVTSTPTAAVAPAPLPAVSVGSQTVTQGIAGNVETTDGRATVSWQPGAVPVGLTVALDARDDGLPVAGSGVALSAAGLGAAGFSWPLDVAYTQAQPAHTVLGYSTDGKVFSIVPQLDGPQLPQGSTIGSYVDGSGLVHVLTLQPVRLGFFEKGAWGDPRYTSAAGPTLERHSKVRVLQRRKRTVLVLTRLSAKSQTRLVAFVRVRHGRRVSVLGKGSRLGPRLRTGHAYRTVRTERDKPGGIVVRLHLNGRTLQHRRRYVVRLWAVDPWGRHQRMVLNFLYR
ncbi:MAG TPA: GH25 family lysozyme [Gaiellaceae bacterium]|nr:GH25 family lysozyme [Gaiellaceae bacterium]